MPRILNPASGNESVADSFSKLGDIFSNGAQQDLIRQNAIAKGAENKYAEPYARAPQSGDSNGTIYYGALARKQMADVANGNLLARTNHANGVDDPNVALAQMGAHEPIASTAVGQGRDLANRTGIARIQSDTQAANQLAITERQNAQQQWTDEHTLVDVQRPDGVIVKVPKSQLAQVQGQGYRTPLTLDQVKAGMFAPSAPQTAPQNASAPAGPPSTTSLDPDRRHILGLETGTQTYMHPGLRMSAVSHDGGQTITLPDGRTMPAAGSGFQPASNEAALQQSRDNIQIGEAQHPMAGAGQTGPSQAALDANTAAGSGARLLEHANGMVGLIPGAGAAARAVGYPVIGPGTVDAQQQQDQRNQETMSTLMGNPGRPSNFSQALIKDLLPEEGYARSGAVEANKVAKIQQRLKQEYAEAQAVATNPNTPSDVRQKYLDHMRRVEKTYGLWASPAQGGAQQPQQAPQAPAPQQGGAQAAQPPTKIINGKTYFRQNGQWFEQ